ncbi:alpha/beta hydrolase [Pseudonocardia sp. MCCB 268]|nr:alpha/beta hydrolase [Pseudonocardia cytotoxica]
MNTGRRRLGRRRTAVRSAAAVDYRGHGLSGPSGSVPAGRFPADDALAVPEHLGWDRVHPVGGSIGGAVAVAVAARPCSASRARQHRLSRCHPADRAD